MHLEMAEVVDLTFWAGYKRLKLMIGKLHVHKMKTVMVLLLTSIFLCNTLTTNVSICAQTLISLLNKWYQESPEETSF